MVCVDADAAIPRRSTDVCDYDDVGAARALLGDEVLELGKVLELVDVVDMDYAQLARGGRTRRAHLRGCVPP